MSENRVRVFFYGSYINLDVLAAVDLTPDPSEIEIASVQGFELCIAPLANLVASEGSSAYGILTRATHEELERLYAHARDVLGGVYRPEAVVARSEAGVLQPALCYVAAEMKPGPASDDYVDRIAGPARRYAFPDWYVQKIESFRS